MKKMYLVLVFAGIAGFSKAQEDLSSEKNSRILRRLR